MARKALINSAEDRLAARAHAHKLGKKEKFPTRVYHRCKLCGRGKGYLRYFEICRICFREKASCGQMVGIKKASW